MEISIQAEGHEGQLLKRNEDDIKTYLKKELPEEFNIENIETPGLSININEDSLEKKIIGQKAFIPSPDTLVLVFSTIVPAITATAAMSTEIVKLVGKIRELFKDLEEKEESNNLTIKIELGDPVNKEITVSGDEGVLKEIIKEAIENGL